MTSFCFVVATQQNDLECALAADAMVLSGAGIMSFLFVCLFSEHVKGCQWLLEIM